MGHYVIACDWKKNAYMDVSDFCDEFRVVDLRELGNCLNVTVGCDHVYHLAADMGGMGFISNNHASIMYNNTIMSFHMLEACRYNGVKRYFFASSACVYPEHLQSSTQGSGLREIDAWPAAPQDAYGLEKLVTEELCMHYSKTYGIETRIGRYHNVYGPKGTWTGGREKAPAAMCRKIAASIALGNSDPIEVWGDGEQTRSFMYIDDCIEGTLKLMASDYIEPINIGTSELVSINDLIDVISKVADIKDPIERTYIVGPEGVRGRNSDNTRIRHVLEWEPSISLADGIAKVYPWIVSQMSSASPQQLLEFTKSMQYINMN
jgi:GDP-D-mannose 3',5'-epimerase